MNMSKPRPLRWSEPSVISRYSIAFLSVATATVAAGVLTSLLRTEPIASSMLCAVIFVAWLGGFGPGLLTIALALFAFHYYLAPPINSITWKHNLFIVEISEIPRLILFSITALFVVSLSAAQRRVTDSLRRTRDDLQQAVQKLQQAERESQQTIDTIPALVARYRADGSREFVNQT